MRGSSNRIESKIAGQRVTGFAKIPGFILTGAILISIVLAAPPAKAALRYTVETASTYKNETSYVVEDIAVDGDRARVDIKAGKQDKLQPEGYMLTTDGGITWAVVDGANAVCGQWNLGAYYREAGSIITKVEKWVNAKVTEANVNIRPASPGPEILGFETTHVRIIVRLKAKATVFFMKFEYHLVITDDVWFAPDIKVNQIEQRWLDALARTGYERIDKLTATASAAIQGMVLKQKTVTHARDLRKNRERTKIDEINVTSFASVEPRAIPNEVFRTGNCRPVSEGQMEDAAKDMLKSIVKPR